jgi:signal transduction histidine kinase
MNRILHGILLIVMAGWSCGAYAQTDRPGYAQYDSVTIKAQIERAIELEQRNTDSAIAAFRGTLKNSEELPYANGVINSLKHLGVLYSNKGMYDECLETFTKTKDRSLRTKELSSVLPVAYNGMANIYKMKGDYEEAAKHYYQALLIADKLGIQTSGSIYNNMGSVQMFLKQYDKAYYYLDKAEALAKKTNNYDLLASIYTNRGVVYKDEKKYQESLKNLKEALRIARQQDLTDAEYNTLTNIGQVYLAQEDPGTALEYLLKTKDIKGDINPYYRAVTLETIGVAYSRSGNDKAAEIYFLQGLDLSNKQQLQENKMSLNEKLAEIYAASGAFEKAYRYMATATRLKDSVKTQNTDQTISRLDIRYRTSEREKELARKQLKIAQQENFLKKKNFWLVMISVGGVLLGLLLVLLFRSNRHKQGLQKKQIQILQQQQQILKGGQQIGQLKAMMQGEEKERTRIARELHDGIGGMLTAINMNISALQKKHSHLPEIKDLNEIMTMLQSTAIEVRKTAHNLMPDILLKYTLPEALHLYCEHIDTDNKLQINLQLYGPLEELDKFLALSLYRIIQELVQNIIKHSKATITEIQLRQDGEKLTITVEDNGIGFDKNVKTRGLGLQNVRSRIDALHGFISIESAPGMGTTVYIELDTEKMENHHHEDTHSYSG